MQLIVPFLIALVCWDEIKQLIDDKLRYNVNNCVPIMLLMLLIRLYFGESFAYFLA